MIDRKYIETLFDKWVKKLRLVPAWDIRLEWVEDPTWRKTGDFKIDFGKKVVISKDGLVGKFLVTYTDKKSNISTVELKLGSNNELSLDCTELYLDMKPVLEYLQEKDVDNAKQESENYLPF